MGTERGRQQEVLGPPGESQARLGQQVTQGQLLSPVGPRSSLAFQGPQLCPLSQHLPESHKPQGRHHASPSSSSTTASHRPPLCGDNNEAENVARRGIDLFIYHSLIKSFLPPVKIPMISFAQSNRSVPETELSGETV